MNLKFENNSPKALPIVNLTENLLISRTGYWYIVTDIQNIFSHTQLSIELLSNQETLSKYVIYISSMQGLPS